MSNVTPQSDSAAGRTWLPLNIGSALAIAVIVSMLAFLLTSDGGSPVGAEQGLAPSADSAAGESGTGDQPTATPEPAPPSQETGGLLGGLVEPGIEAAPPTTVAAASSFAGFGEDASRSASFAVLASELTNMGPTEIGFVMNFPTVEYEWERVEVAVGATYEIGWLGELNGQLAIVSPTWDESFDGGQQRLVTAVSADGLSWEEVGTYELQANTWVSRVVSDGELVYALAENYDEPTGSNQSLLYSSSDGIEWNELELALGAEDGEHTYIQNAAAGPAGIALAVSFESYPEQEPSLLDFGDYQVELDHMANTYTLFDAGGQEVLTGSIDELFNWGSDGQNIYNPETGELLTTVPWEVWERSFNQFYEGNRGGSPLPIPTNPVEQGGTPVITIEYDGLVIVIDDYAYEFTVSDAESGEEIASGSLEYVYQGPPPRFVDPASGEVLLSVTWDEWYRAEEESYMHFESEYYEYSSRTELLTSTDGVAWDSTTVPARQGAHVAYLIPTQTGFVAMVSTYGEFGDQRSLWTLDNGVWSSTEAENSDLWLYQVALTDDGFLGVGEGPGGPALWASADGVDWVSEFAIVPQDDGSYVSMAAVAVDDDGTVGALARREKWSEYRPLVIEKDGYTLTFEDGETVLSVVETSTGTEVLSLSWMSFDDGSGSDLVTWEDGVTLIQLEDGDVLAISDDEAYAAMESRWSDQGQLGLSVFIRDGSRWSEAIVEVEGGLSGASRLHMVDGRIIIGGTFWSGGGERYYSEVAEQGTFVVIIGTPIGG